MARRNLIPQMGNKGGKGGFDRMGHTRFRIKMNMCWALASKPWRV